MRVVDQLCHDPGCACSSTEMTASLFWSVFLREGGKILLWPFMPGRSCFASTHDAFLGHRGPRSARKHRDGSLASWSHVAQRCVCVSMKFSTSFRRKSVGPFRLAHRLQTRSVSPQIWLAQPPSSCLADTHARFHACACCISTVQDQSDVIGFINRRPSLRRNTAARLS